MHFPEGQKGISKIFSAEILQLIGAVIIVAGTLLSAAGVAGGIVGLILVGIGLVVDLVAYIFQLLGLHVAGVSDPAFKKGFTVAIIALIVAIVGGVLVFILGGVTQDIVEIVGMIFEIIILVFVCSGIYHLADQIKGQGDLALTAKKLRTTIIVIFVLAIIFKIVGAILINAAPAFMIIFSVCYIVAKIAAYVTYLIVLARAKHSF